GLRPALGEKLTNLLEIICFMFRVPLRPKTVRLPFGPPLFHSTQIFCGYGGAPLRLPQESSIFVRILLLVTYPILFTLPLKLVPAADQRLVPNINDGIISNIDVGISINSGISRISRRDDTQKAAVGPRKAIDNCTRCFLCRALGSVLGSDILNQIAEPLRTAYQAPLLICFG